MTPHNRRQPKSGQTLPEVRDIAIDLSEEVGGDPTIYAEWSARNATDADYSSPDANRARSGSIPLGDISISLRTRAVGDGRADLVISLVWPQSGEDFT
jgi:hypothetical protein